MMFLVLAILLPCSAGRDDPALVGQKVVTKEATPLRIENRIVDQGKYFRVYTAAMAQGKWLWLVSGNVQGWVKADEVVPWDRAEDYYSAQIEEFPEYAWAFHRRGIVRALMGEIDLAFDDYQEAIQLDPEFSDAYANRGNLWRARGKLDHAIADYDDAIRVSPLDAASYYNRGNAWGDKQDNARAVADFTEAIRLDPRFVQAYTNRAAAWYRMGRYPDAIRDANVAIQLDPKHVNAYMCRGMAWQGLTDIARAIADYGDALKLDPVDPTPIRYRAQLLLYLRRYEEAASDLDALVRLSPREAWAYDRRAWIWATALDARLRDGKNAVEYAVRACELNEWKDPGHLHTLAAAYAEAGDFAKAVEYQERSLLLPANQAIKPWGERRLAHYKDKKPLRDDER